MATARRMGTETSETRARLLDITARVMIEEGHAAVSTRGIAREAALDGEHSVNNDDRRC